MQIIEFIIGFIIGIKRKWCDALANKVADGLWAVVVGVEDPDVVVNESAHKRIFPEILRQNGMNYLNKIKTGIKAIEKY